MTDPHTPVAEPKSLDEALLMLQADPPVLTKSKKGQVGNQLTKYADLPQVNAQVLSRLNALGVIWKCKPMMVSYEGAPPQFVLRYRLTHVPTGEYEEGDYPLKLAENPQQMGSAITYSRRYALLAITGIAAEDEDNDGDTPGGRAPAQRRPAQKRTAMTPSAEPTAADQSPPVPLPGDGPAEPHRGRGGLITESMTRKLAITMKQAIGDNPADRKQYIVDMIGREVATSKDLTFDEGRGLIDAFEKANRDPDTAAATVIDIYRRVHQAGGPAHNDPLAEDDTPEGKARIAGPLANPDQRQPGQRSRNAAEAIGNGGDEGVEDAPWEGVLPV
jgi:hypothetical protein